ncbi:hypothetical protein OKW96_11775 [Sphingobacterium sp. KU25419]|nr:hypothetical protein OKW96_11775 [Sphingobacterium sp. KU25419]
MSWIAELTKDSGDSEAYKLLPNVPTRRDDLTEAYKNGLEKAKAEIGFILNGNKS